MSESFIPTPAVTGARGKNLKSFKTTDGGSNDVESEGVTITDGTTGAEIRIATEATLADVALSVRPEGSLQVGSEISVTSSVAVQLLPDNPTRRGFIIQNNGSGNVRVGPIGIQSTIGLRLLPDAILVASPPFLPTDALYAIAEAATSAVFATEIV